MMEMMEERAEELQVKSLKGYEKMIKDLG